MSWFDLAIMGGWFGVFCVSREVTIGGLLPFEGLLLFMWHVS